MAFSYGFFNAKNMDRVYTAEDFTGYLSSIICNGIFDTYGDCFSVTAADGLSVQIGSGKAWIDGHYFTSDSDYTLDLSIYMDESLSRYVTIGISCDTSDNVRACKLEVKSGTAATSPSIPVFTNTDAKTYLTLAAVYLKGGAKSITDSNIRDVRSDEKKCGYVKCVLGKCRVSEILSALSVYASTVSDLSSQVETLTQTVSSLETRLDDFTSDVVKTGNIGNSAYYILYSNGRVAIRGTGETYSYEISDSPFHENLDITALDVGEGITALGKSLFEQCRSMKTLSLPSTLKTVEERCFFMYSIGGPTELLIPKNMSNIGEKAFACCAFESVTIPENIRIIDNYAFYDCTKLKSAYVRCATVGGFMFTRCTALTKLTLSTNVKTIKEHCINYCSKLTEITYEGTLEQFKAITGYNYLMSAAYCGLNKIACVDGGFTLNGENWEEYT